MGHSKSGYVWIAVVGENCQKKLEQFAVVGLTTF